MAKRVFQMNSTQFLLQKRRHGGLSASDHIVAQWRAIRAEQQTEQQQAERQARFQGIGDRVRARFERPPTTTERIC